MIDEIMVIGLWLTRNYYHILAELLMWGVDPFGQLPKEVD